MATAAAEPTNPSEVAAAAGEELLGSVCGDRRPRVDSGGAHLWEADGTADGRANVAAAGANQTASDAPKKQHQQHQQHLFAPTFRGRHHVQHSPSQPSSPRPMRWGAVMAISALRSAEGASSSEVPFRAWRLRRPTLLAFRRRALPKAKPLFCFSLSKKKSSRGGGNGGGAEGACRSHPQASGGGSRGVAAPRRKAGRRPYRSPCQGRARFA